MTRVAGHSLWHEGAAYDDRGCQIEYPRTSEGRGKCECGALSGVLPSGAARRRWHREVHKPEAAGR